jgi:hypothetical protein
MGYRKLALLVLSILLSCFSANAVRLKVTGGNVYESRNPFEFNRFVIVGNSLSNYPSGDVFNFDYPSRKMSWQDYKGKSTYKMDEVDYQGNITVFSTPHHIVKVTKESSRYIVELVYRDGNKWYLLKLNCTEQ